MNIRTLHTQGAGYLVSVLLCFITAAATLFFTVAGSQAEVREQKGFNSPEEALESLVAAVRAHDLNEMLAILGPGSRELISSGDEASDRAEREKFLSASNEMLNLSQKSADTVIVSVGVDNWPMPVPIVKKGSVWIFDTLRGKGEILNRRIGRNELFVMEVLQAFVDAQHEYAIKNCSGSGKVEFAHRIISSEGKHDGLYWEAGGDGEESPLGPLVAQAAKEGYANPDLQPFHGYYFKILQAQGSHADGGAYHYVVNDKMILGFAIIAYPAEYGNSGVMTFMVNQQGVIYQKNLGKNTKHSAEAMTIFDPDKTWTKAEEPGNQNKPKS
ncbi:MAG: DUF2950 domain-containing protein [Nitrospirota bacterium]